MPLLSHLAADAINREYQAGGDAATLERLCLALACGIEHTDERSEFLDIASMGGLRIKAECPSCRHSRAHGWTEGECMCDEYDACDEAA